MPNENHAETIQRLTLAAIDYARIQNLPDGRTVVFRPAGPGLAEFKDITLDHNKEPPKPKFISVCPEIQTVASLIDYVNRFKTADTMIFACSEEEIIKAVIDYHKEGSQEAGLVRHQALLRLTTSNEFDTWCARDGDWMAQKAFARFLELNAEEIASPKGAELLEMVLDLEKSKTVTVQRKLRSAGSDDGSAGFTSDASGTVLPASFKLAMPIFFGEDNKVEIIAYTKDQMGDGKIEIGYELNRLDIIRQREFARITRGIADATGVPFVLGKVFA